MHLHPDLHRLLRRFDARRRKLLYLRGLLTGSTVLFLCVFLCALLDKGLSCDNQTRLAFSLVIYLSVIYMVWLRAGKRLLIIRTPVDLARALEQSSPMLKGEVLSAVELSHTPEILIDSQILRNLQQQRTAEKVAFINCDGLLPWSKLKLDAVLMTLVVVILTAAFIIEGSPFVNRCLRFLLPFSEINRFSDTQIEVLTPSQDQKYVPADEMVKVSAKIKSNQSLKPVLLVSSIPLGKKRISMEPSGDNGFQSEVKIAADPIDYQIKAGDALTPLYHLVPVSRPHVVSITRCYVPPAYSGLPDSTETSTDGSIKAIEGTSVALVFKADQAVTNGTLEYTQGSFSESVPLLKDSRDETVLLGRIQLKQSGFYSLRITAKATAFESLRGNESEITVEPDAPPRVILQSPEQDLRLALGDKVQWAGTVDDDLQVSSIVQQVRLNNGSWISLPTQNFKDKHINLNGLWDPLEQRPMPGDIIAARFIATDSKGQSAESRVMQISIVSRELVPSPPPELIAQRSITKRIEDLLKQANAAAKALQDGRLEVESKSPNRIKQAQAFARAKQSLDQANESSLEARRLLLNELRRETDPQALEGLALQSHVLNRIQIGELQPAQSALNGLSQRLSGGERPTALQLEMLRHSAESAAQGSSLAHSLKDAASTRLAMGEAKLLVKTAEAVGVEQERITGHQKPTELEEKIQTLATSLLQDSLRTQQINQSISADLQKDIQLLVEHSAATASRVKSVRMALLDSQQTADRLLTTAQMAAPVPKGDSTEIQSELGSDKFRTASVKAAQAGNALAKTLAQTADALASLGPALDEAEAKAWSKLRSNEVFHAERISQMARELDSLGARKQMVLSEKNSISSERFEVEAAVLRAHAKVEANRRYASALIDFELRTAAAAVEAAVPSDDTPITVTKTKIQDIARALQVLEAVAKLDEAKKNADALADQIPQEIENRSSVQAGRLNATGDLLRRLAPELRRAGLPEEAATAAEASYQAFKSDTSERMNESRKSLETAFEATSEAVGKARATLKSLVPSLATRMDALAEKSEAAASQTQALQTEAGKGQPGALTEILQSAAQLNIRIEDLREELQSDASRQNSMSEEGRALARDSDAAAAQLKDSGRALAALNDASHSKSNASEALARAVDQQNQTAQKLRKLAEHFRNIENEDRDKVTESRKGLRDSEVQTGIQNVLENREKMAAALGEISAASPDEARMKIEQLGASQQSAQDLEASAHSQSATDSKTAIQQAVNAAKAGRIEEAERAMRVAAAALEDASRLERSGEGIAQGSIGAGDLEKVPLESQDLPSSLRMGDSRWGNLPKHIADDLMKGNREQSPQEYRSAIDSYFQAVAERARGGNTRP
jgi:hypothetical protein